MWSRRLGTASAATFACWIRHPGPLYGVLAWLAALGLDINSYLYAGTGIPLFYCLLLPSSTQGHAHDTCTGTGTRIGTMPTAR